LLLHLGGLHRSLAILNEHFSIFHFFIIFGFDILLPFQYLRG
jgi:hypothetical protein